VDADAISVASTASHVQIGGFGTTFLATDEAYALIQHSLGGKLIGAPPHRHNREDELSYVLEGTLTVWREGVVTEAGPGTLVTKPRGEWHTFWNAGDVTVRFLEIISPPDFANYFRELATIIPESGPPDPARVMALAARYELEFDFRMLGQLTERYGLRLG
jgi:mannose-6-phosphate isomerase-like protein (cupin superfamily)